MQASLEVGKRFGLVVGLGQQVKGGAREQASLGEEVTVR